MMSVGEMGKGTRYAFKGKPGKNTFFLSFFNEKFGFYFHYLKETCHT
jgi:hypothetical protein